MKISWGIKIILSFVIFAAGIISMVAISISNSTDLVSENYYEQEIKYQDRIDILHNSVNLNESILIESNSENVTVRVSNLSNIKDLKGEIHFYRTSDAGKDFKIKFDPSPEGVQKVTCKTLEKGIWKIMMSLSDGSKNYFIEKSIFNR